MEHHLNGVSDASTTANDSGVFQMATQIEYVAGIWNNTSNANINKIISSNGRYYDLYESKTSKMGDATTETQKWHGAKTFDWISNEWPIFYRGNELFNVYRERGSAWSPGSRAVVVCGKGL